MSNNSDNPVPLSGNKVSEDKQPNEDPRATNGVEKEIKCESCIEEASDNRVKEEDSQEDAWDGSEAEFIEDDDAADYEEKQTGIKLNYTLKKHEIYSCIKHVNFSTLYNLPAVIKSIILLIISGVFFYTYLSDKNSLNLLFSCFSFLVIILVWVAPFLRIRKTAENLTTGKKIEIEIYPDSIVVCSDDPEWEIPLDGSCSFEEKLNMMLIFLPDHKIFIIPIRSIEPDLVADIQAMIISGTVPRKTDS